MFSEFPKKCPKALLDINGKTILSRQISLFRKNGINDIIVITGPYWEKFDFENITNVPDNQYAGLISADTFTHGRYWT